MSSIDTIEKIELFMNNQLTGKELEVFEQQTKEDPELQGKIECYKLAVEEIMNKGRASLKDKLQDIHFQVVENIEKKRVTRHYLVSAAAVIAGISIISALFLYLGVLAPKSSKNSLFAEYFKPYINVNAYRGDNIDQVTALQKTAMYYYTNKQFDKAIPNFEELFKNTKSPGDDMVFYYGITCLGVGQNLKAISSFSKLSVNNRNLFYEQSMWYLSLAYLKDNNVAKCREILRSIIKGKGTYANSALDLLEKID